MREVSNSKLSRLLARKKPFVCTDVPIGDTVLVHRAANRKSAPRRRGPAKIFDIAETGVAVKFQSQTFRVARYCVRKKVEEKDVEKAKCNPSSTQLRPMETAPWARDDLRGEEDEMEVEKETAPIRGLQETAPITPRKRFRYWRLRRYRYRYHPRRTPLLRILQGSPHLAEMANSPGHPWRIGPTMRR